MPGHLTQEAVQIILTALHGPVSWGWGVMSERERRDLGNTRARGSRTRALICAARPESRAARSSRIAVNRVAGEVGVEAQRAETARRLGKADHGEGAGVMLAVERREAREPAICRILRRVEPETDVEGVGR